MDVDVVIVSCTGATTGEDGTRPHIQMARQKKALFDIATEKETFFGARDAIRQNLGKSHVYEMPPTFDYTLKERPSRQHGTL